jgi:hypothetical protein
MKGCNKDGSSPVTFLTLSDNKQSSRFTARAGAQASLPHITHNIITSSSLVHTLFFDSHRYLQKIGSEISFMNSAGKWFERDSSVTEGQTPSRPELNPPHLRCVHIQKNVAAFFSVALDNLPLVP